MVTVVTRVKLTDACTVCGVPAGINCRSTSTWVTYTREVHDIPVVETDAEKRSIQDDYKIFYGDSKLSKASEGK